jgi:hypothetical protein
MWLMLDRHIDGGTIAAESDNKMLKLFAPFPQGLSGKVSLQSHGVCDKISWFARGEVSLGDNPRCDLPFFGIISKFEREQLPIACRQLSSKGTHVAQCLAWISP